MIQSRRALCRKEQGRLIRPGWQGFRRPLLLVILIYFLDG